MSFTSRISKTTARTMAVLALAFLATLGGPAAKASAGPIEWQATGGWYTDNGDFFVGAGARFSLATFTVIPNAEYVFVDGGSLYTLNIDGTMNILPLGVASGYVGVGVGMVITDPDGGDSNNDTGFNVIAGAGLNAMKFKPFGQLKWIVQDGDDPLVLAFGIRF